MADPAPLFQHSRHPAEHNRLLSRPPGLPGVGFLAEDATLKPLRQTTVKPLRQKAGVENRASDPTPVFHQSSHPAERKRSVSRPPGLPALGFLVADATLTPLWANNEAITILTYYSAKAERQEALADAFDKKIRRTLSRGQGSLTVAPRAIQFSSGRRTYSCRAFLLDDSGHPPGSARVVMVLERGIPGSLALCQVSEQFHLTRREQEIVTLLLQGLSNKEMAERMAISANTVKVLLQLVMAKMRVSSRSAVVATVIGLMLSATSPQKELTHLTSRRHPQIAA